jgi:hypothetical protein
VSRRHRNHGGYAELGQTWRASRSGSPCGSRNGTGRDIPLSCECWNRADWVGVRSCNPAPCPDCDGTGVIR